jgi:hypothetical protein
VSEYRYVVGPSEGGSPPHVERVPIVRFRLIGAAEPEPTPGEVRDEFMLGLRDAGIGPEPVASYDQDGMLHLDWPDLPTHLLDADSARLLALASLPLDREVPELASTALPDPEHMREVARVAADDRERWAEVKRLVTVAAEIFAVEKRRARRLAKRPRPEVTPSARPRPRGRVWTGKRRRR